MERPAFPKGVWSRLEMIVFSSLFLGCYSSWYIICICTYLIICCALNVLDMENLPAAQSLLNPICCLSNLCYCIFSNMQKKQETRRCEINMRSLFLGRLTSLSWLVLNFRYASLWTNLALESKKPYQIWEDMIEYVRPFEEWGEVAF